jgi:hypothetical protein
VSEAIERLHRAIAARAHQKFFDDGEGWISTEDTEAARVEARGSGRQLQIVLRELCESWDLEDKHHGLYVTQPHYALRYEMELDRGEFRSRNGLRRRMLAALLDADENGGDGFNFEAKEEGWTQHSDGELVAAGKTLETLGLAEVVIQTFGYIGMTITGEGVRVMTDSERLASTLPVTEADDLMLGASIVPDAMQTLIFDCEQLLAERGWTEALRELEAGDSALAGERWVEAVREYYRAVESGMKYRLAEVDVSHGDTTALRRLAGLAAEHGLIPSNYQAPFVFLDSIRSPKAHGAGPKPRDVEVGRHEALLMGNHARALLIYLGGRAS